MKLSEHLTTEECACRCGCGDDRPEPELVQMFETVRHALGDEPITPNSVIRCEAYNRSVGGDRRSWHMRGQAMDFPALSKAERFQIGAAAIGAGATDIGVYDWGVHVAVNTPLGLWRGK